MTTSRKHRIRQRRLHRRALRAALQSDIGKCFTQLWNHPETRRLHALAVKNNTVASFTDSVYREAVNMALSLVGTVGAIWPPRK